MEQKRPFEVWDGPLERVPDHPAIWGLCIGDEPSGLDFPYYGKLLPHLKSKRPGLGYYVCLFPCYAMPGTAGKDPASTQLGLSSYTRYIEEWCRNVDVDYVATDIYPWGWSVTRSQFFENMRIVADAAQAAGRTWNSVFQGNKFYEDYGGNVKSGRSMTANTMRFQANAALAYGIDHIWWGCWTRGWWTENVVNEKGEIDARVLEMFKTVNWELKTLGREYVKYRRISTELVGFGKTSLDDGKIRQPFVDSANSAAFSDVRAEDGAALTVGHMVARDGSGRYAMMVVAADDPDDERDSPKHALVFKVPFGRKVTAFAGTGPRKVKDLGDGSYAVGIRANEGVILVAEDPI